MSEECWRANIDEKGRVCSCSRLLLTTNNQLLIASYAGLLLLFGRGRAARGLESAEQSQAAAG
jgi:hypothetical protein